MSSPLGRGVSPYAGASVAVVVNNHESCWLSSSMATSRVFFSLGDVEREGEKEGRERERGGDCRSERGVSSNR